MQSVCEMFRNISCMESRVNERKESIFRDIFENAGNSKVKYVKGYVHLTNQSQDSADDVFESALPTNLTSNNLL